MRPILVADDDPVMRLMIRASLAAHGYESCEAEDGLSALRSLVAPEAPLLALLDWEMPGLQGPEICRVAREKGVSAHIIMVTSRGSTAHLVHALSQGADDFVRKPFEPDELIARVKVGLRLQRAHEQVKQLEGMISICMFCKAVRTPDDGWQRVEAYLEKNGDAAITHGMCEGCYRKNYGGE